MEAGKPDYSRGRHLRINAGVFLAKGPDPDYSNLQFIRHFVECTIEGLGLTSLNLPDAQGNYARAKARARSSPAIIYSSCPNSVNPPILFTGGQITAN